jgi:hypothetical protein
MSWIEKLEENRLSDVCDHAAKLMGWRMKKGYWVNDADDMLCQVSEWQPHSNLNQFALVIKQSRQLMRDYAEWLETKGETPAREHGPFIVAAMAEGIGSWQSALDGPAVALATLLNVMDGLRSKFYPLYGVLPILKEPKKNG